MFKQIYVCFTPDRKAMIAFPDLATARDSWRLSYSRHPGKLEFVGDDERITKVFLDGKDDGTIEQVNYSEHREHL